MKKLVAIVLAVLAFVLSIAAIAATHHINNLNLYLFNQAATNVATMINGTAHIHNNDLPTVGKENVLLIWDHEGNFGPWFLSTWDGTLGNWALEASNGRYTWDNMVNAAKVDAPKVEHLLVLCILMVVLTIAWIFRVYIRLFDESLKEAYDKQMIRQAKINSYYEANDELTPNLYWTVVELQMCKPGEIMTNEIARTHKHIARVAIDVQTGARSYYVTGFINDRGGISAETIPFRKTTI